MKRLSWTVCSHLDVSGLACFEVCACGCSWESWRIHIGDKALAWNDIPLTLRNLFHKLNVNNPREWSINIDPRRSFLRNTKTSAALTPKPPNLFNDGFIHEAFGEVPVQTSMDKRCHCKAPLGEFMQYDLSFRFIEITGPRANGRVRAHIIGQHRNS